MALVTADRVKETTTVTTGTATLLGAATGFQSFAVIGNSNTTYYCIAGQTTSEWEVGIGTYSTSGTTLARTTILANSSATQPTELTFSAGTKDVFVTYPSSKGVYLDASGNAIGLGTPAAFVATNVTGLPISTGVSGLGTSVATALAVNVGTAGSPVINGGALGTPSSGTLTSATGLPISTGISGLGTGVATALGVNTGSANAFVVNGGALGTPSSGVISACTSTSMALTTPVISTISNTGTVTLPTSTDTLVGRATTDTLTNKTLTNPTVTNYVESVVAIGTVTSSSTLSLTSGTVQTATLTASTACTFTMPTATAGKSFVLLLKQAATTGNGTATFTSVKFGTAGAPTITATAGKMDILTFIADGTNWYGSIAQGYTP